MIVLRDSLIVVATLGSVFSGAAEGAAPASSSYSVPFGFPTSLFSSYYVPPSPTQEPNPIIYDEVLNLTFPFNLTNPKAIPTTITDPVYFPSPTVSLSAASQTAAVQSAAAQVQKILDGGNKASNCSKCTTTLQVGQSVARTVPQLLPPLLIQLCQAIGLSSNSTCATTYTAPNLGQIWTQALAYADVGGEDGRYMCNFLSSTFCPPPGAVPLDTKGLFPKAKPAKPRKPKPSGKRVKVMHLSDMHLDPRYFATAEANCSLGLCCRANNNNKDLPKGQISMPASLYGSFKCDSPYDLIGGALQAIAPLTGLSSQEAFGWSIYTGDLVSHDSPATEIDRKYVEYTEKSLYQMIADYVKGPVFAALGNHDTNPIAIDAPHSLSSSLGTQFSWNYDHVSALWLNDGWIDAKTAATARTHYGAFSTKNHFGLRVISINTDFWYRSNILNYINTTNPDVSGTFKFLIKELQAAENACERVWIIGHVLSGWDGSNPLPNPTNLFYQIVDRYSPHVIAGVFFGHTHEDQNMIFYANNGTVRNADTALTPAWIGPSVTPLTNLNTGFRMYEVDTGTFEVLESYTFFANVSSFAGLGTSAGPTFQYEFSFL